MNEDAQAITPDDSLGKLNLERPEMKFITPTILAGLLAGAASLSFGQGQDQHGPGGPGGPGGPEGGHRPPPSPIFEALDLNHDGVISADELAKASESLKKLDKNGDGQLTHDELRPPRPEGDRGGDRAGQSGQQGQNNQGPGSRPSQAPERRP